MLLFITTTKGGGYATVVWLQNNLKSYEQIQNSWKNYNDIFRKYCIISQRKDNYILVMFQILQGLWPLIIQASVPRGFDHKPLLVTTVYILTECFSSSPCKQIIIKTFRIIGLWALKMICLLLNLKFQLIYKQFTGILFNLIYNFFIIYL